jgi:hypothetical protein
VAAGARERFGAVAAVLLCVVACSSDDSSPPPSTDVQVEAGVLNEARCLDAPVADEPVLGLLDGALAAATEHYGAAPELFELSIDRQRVSMVAAVDGGAAEQSFFCGADGFAPPEPLGGAEGETFASDAIEIDPDAIFDGVRDELEQPEIVELVIVGGAGGTTRMAVSVQSDAGGVLFVEIGPGGDVLSVQAL